jgi:hypothetical protein
MYIYIYINHYYTLYPLLLDSLYINVNKKMCSITEIIKVKDYLILISN